MGISTQVLLTKINSLESDVEYLKTQIQELLNNQQGFYPHKNFEPHRPTSKCTVCGMKFEGAMGYVCMNTQCPTKVMCRSE